LAFQSDKDRRRKSAEAADAPGGRDSKGSDDKARPPRRRAARPEVGNALRAAYQQAVSEDIPPEMLDLLGKLG
jgi:hypothetical protein